MTMFYALVGIPLNLVMYQSLGERLNTLSASSIRTVKKFFQCKNPNEVKQRVVSPCTAVVHLLPF